MLRKGIAPHDWKVGANTAGDRGVGELMVYQILLTTQSLLLLIEVFNAEEVQATPMTSRGLRKSQGHSQWSPKIARWVGECFKTLFFFIMWGSWSFGIVSRYLVQALV